MHACVPCVGMFLWRRLLQAPLKLAFFLCLLVLGCTAAPKQRWQSTHQQKAAFMNGIRGTRRKEKARQSNGCQRRVQSTSSGGHDLSSCNLVDGAAAATAAATSSGQCIYSPNNLHCSRGQTSGLNEQRPQLPLIGSVAEAAATACGGRHKKHLQPTHPPTTFTDVAAASTATISSDNESGRTCGRQQHPPLQAPAPTPRSPPPVP